MPVNPALYRDRQHKAELEARNAFLQFDFVLSEIHKSVLGFTLKPDTILELQRLAIQDIYVCAGQFRTGPVIITNTHHQPPAAEFVPIYVEEMCDYVNTNWNTSPIHLAAYLLWRHNWIHPFFGGNGRTSRAVSYLALCARLGYPIPGTLTIPQQIEQNRDPYYNALRAADAAWREKKLDLSAMEQMLSDMLAAQLLSVHKAATGRE
jgi:Fic family protein